MSRLIGGADRYSGPEYVYEEPILAEVMRFDPDTLAPDALEKLLAEFRLGEQHPKTLRAGVQTGRIPTEEDFSLIRSGQELPPPEIPQGNRLIEYKYSPIYSSISGGEIIKAMMRNWRNLESRGKKINRSDYIRNYKRYGALPYHLAISYVEEVLGYDKEEIDELNISQLRRARDNVDSDPGLYASQAFVDRHIGKSRKIHLGFWERAIRKAKGLPTNVWYYKPPTIEQEGKHLTGLPVPS